MPGWLQRLFHLFLTIAPVGRYYYFHFINTEIVIFKKAKVTGLKMDR